MQTRKLHRLFNIDTSLIVAIRKGRSGYSRIAYSLARWLGSGHVGVISGSLARRGREPLPR